jgi:hypothetical protein
MSTTLHLKCDGCEAEVHSEPIKKRFESVSGRSYGFGTWQQPVIDEVVQSTGWVWSDPYTSCTYCPKCWDAVENGERVAEARQAMNNL